ncbi:hypothetical protein SGPA1_30489 [Streptomyces misionensis JCM 4497]
MRRLAHPGAVPLLRDPAPAPGPGREGPGLGRPGAAVRAGRLRRPGRQPRRALRAVHGVHGAQRAAEHLHPRRRRRGLREADALAAVPAGRAALERHRPGLAQRPLLLAAHPGQRTDPGQRRAAQGAGAGEEGAERGHRPVGLPARPPGGGPAPQARASVGPAAAVSPGRAALRPPP